MPRPRRTLVVLLTALAALALGACAPPAPPSPPAGWDQHYLTRDGHDTTSLRPMSATSGRVVTGGSNTGVNSRTLFTRHGDQPARDQEVCVRFSSSHALAQEGVAFRVRNDAGRVRAVTITKNIWSGAQWMFNVHTWDTARPGVFRIHGSVDMSAMVGRGFQGDATWNLCGRAEGAQVRAKVWPHGSPEPTWDHPSVGSVTIPGEFTQPGTPGWYAGHIPRGHWSQLMGMAATSPLEVPA